MRRPAFLLLLLLATSCATPPIRLSPSYPPGAVREYRLTADATTQIRVAARTNRERTRLVARSRIEVIGATGDETTLRLTLTPTSFRRDGRALEPPATQRAELVIGPDGAVRRITSVGGLPASIAGGNVDDLAPVIGAPLPGELLRLGATWTKALPAPSDSEIEPGVQRGRIAALRRVGGEDCAIVRLATRRPLVRERSVLGQPLRLSGPELSSSTISFAFRRGYPVLIETDAEGRFAVSTGTFTGGEVTIETRTRLELVTTS